MSTFTTISSDKLARLIGTANGPALIDVRTEEDFAADRRLIPGSIKLSDETVTEWGGDFAGRRAVVSCFRGEKLAQGTAAWLRQLGVEAETLDGGFEGWKAAKLPLLDARKLPPRDAKGRTVWVTRARPKVDRIACPWLIRRFVDPNAVFLFVAPSEVEGVAEQFDAAPFDCEGVFWSHRADQCSFDTMVDELGLAGFEALQHLRLVVRGADTARPELAPQCPGLVAASLGLSRMFADDHEQLEAGMVLYDALYRWCRDAVDETHDWVSHQPKAKKLAPAA